MGFERPSSGTINVLGQVPSPRSTSALTQIAFVPQQSYLYRDVSVQDHLRYVGALRPSFNRPVAERYLDRLRIPLGSRTGQLSGGQRAQVMLAIAIGSNAKLVLLDEPLASLDPLARAEFLEILRDARLASATTFVLSSHVVSDIEAACDFLLLLGQGGVLVCEPIDDLLRRHRVDASATDDDHGQVPATYRVAGRWRMAVDRGDHPAAARERQATLEEVVLTYLERGRGL